MPRQSKAQVVKKGGIDMLVKISYPEGILDNTIILLNGLKEQPLKPDCSTCQ